MRTESPIVDFLLKHNEEQSRAFCDPGETLWRMQHRERHPTRIAALECMDGRVNLALMTKTPHGFIRSFRNVGGRFDLGYDFFGDLLDDWVKTTVRHKANCIILVTYHWSRGHAECGCAGFKHDTLAAQTYTLKLKREIESVFGQSHSVVYPIQIGVETDEDALVIHGEDGSILDIGKETGCAGNDLAVRIRAMFRDMSPSISGDLQSLIENNQHHVNAVRSSGRSIQALNHQERVLAVGRGFDWHRRPNEAIIVGPYSYNMEEPIAVGAHILLKNLNEERIPSEDGVVLITSSPYEGEAGTGRQLAEKRSRSYAKHALEVIEAREPDLLPHLAVLPGIVNVQNRRFSRITLE